MKSTTDSISLEASIDAESQFVYSNLTEDEAVHRWVAMWAGCDVTSIVIDAHPGGAYQVQSRVEGNSQWVLRGMFLSVASDRLCATCEIPGLRGKLPSIELTIKAKGKKTKVGITISGIIGDKANRRLRIGWQRILDMMVHGISRLYQKESNHA